jgi:hypothetical protein
MPMPLIAPLFIEDASTHSEITMVNNSTHPLDVEITLTALSGEQLGMTTVSLAAHEQNVLPIADLFSASPHTPAATFGSIMLMPTRPASLAGQLSIVSHGPFHTEDVEEEFLMAMESKPTNYRAVVGDVSGLPAIAIRSLSAAPQKISVTCVKEDGSFHVNDNLQIAPNQTLLVHACSASEHIQMNSINDVFGNTAEEPGAAGMWVSSSAPSQEIAVFGIGVRGNLARSLVSIPFENVNTLRSTAGVYPGATLSPSSHKRQTFRLRIPMANFGNAPRTVKVWLTKGSGPRSTRELIADTVVAAGTAVQWQSREIHSEPFGGNSVVVEADGAPGELISSVQLQQESQGNDVIGTLPWKDQGQAENGGEHPWSINGGMSSDVLLFNADPKVKNQSVQFTVYADGQFWTRSLTVDPLATVRVSLKDIIQKQELDDKGRSLSKTSMSGIVTWSTGLNPRIFGKLIQADEYTGISRAYACGQYVSACGVALTNPSPNPIAVGEQTEVEVFEVMACTGDAPCECNDGCGSASTTGVLNWETDNSNILTVNSSGGGAGVYTGKSPGQAFASASVVDAQGCYGDGGVQVTVVQNKCFAQLKYRAVTIGDNIPTGYNHAFWWFQDSSLTHWVADGGPSGIYLNSWVVLGDTGHYAADNPSQPTAWSTGDTGSVCSNVYTLHAYASAWPQNATVYNPTGPNSNTFAHDDANAAGFNPPKPPNAIGW